MAVLLGAVLVVVVLSGAGLLWSRRRARGRLPEPEAPPEEIERGSPTIRILNGPDELDDAMRRAAATASRIAAEMAARRFAHRSVVEAPTKLQGSERVIRAGRAKTAAPRRSRAKAGGVEVPTIRPAEPTESTGA